MKATKKKAKRTKRKPARDLIEWYEVPGPDKPLASLGPELITTVLGSFARWQKAHDEMSLTP